MKSESENSRTRSLGDASFVLIDSDTNACIQYTPLNYFPKKYHVKTLLEHLESHDTISPRTDLVDSGISVCSIDVPALFTENFDYQDMKGDFVKGILESDLLGKRIYCHVLGNEYAQRVRNTWMYDAVSRDLMRRSVYPITPDSRILTKEKYELHGPSCYIGSNVKLARYHNYII